MKNSVPGLGCLLIVLGMTSGTSYILGQEAPGRVNIWEETLTLPSYFLNQPEECPMFFQNQSYQGASRVIYPYPYQDNLSMEKGEKEYTGLFLENEYIKLCVLPEIGGRLFYATDKTNGYELFYRQHVIKPMLIGMLGAWISGGVEFCVFHHHRASTHMPVEYRLIENEDGSATIWIGEFEPRHRMRWNIGISLYPGRSWVQVDGNLINATENVNSILYWANVAVHVNEDYQIFFPSGTQFATYHAKNSFCHWPITNEPYVRNEYYRNNIDASWYKNHPEQGSFFAYDIQAGNLAGYDWGKDAGTMYVANPHIAKGAKLWQWGTNSTFDRIALTDNDGPYAELMAGAYSDNQPDYSWIKPYEVKQFRQTWYPLRETRGMKYGNRDAVVNLDLNEDGTIFMAVNTTALYKDARIVLEHEGRILFEKTLDIDPAAPFSREFKAGGVIREEELKIVLLDAKGSQIVSYQPETLANQPELPPVVMPPGPPAEYSTNEELYYAGERIRQFHHARLDPEPYFMEALSRDSLDVRCNTAMGIIRQEDGDFESAKFFYRQAIKRITANYTRPRDCEPLYHLGVILKKEGKFEAAMDTLYRAAWDYEFRSAAYFQLAQVHCMQGDLEAALEAVENSLLVNSHNLSTLCLRTSLLRLQGQAEKAESGANGILDIDPLNSYAFNELRMISDHPDSSRAKDQLLDLLRDNPENYLELATYYIGSGLYAEAAAILEMAGQSDNAALNRYPTIHYYLGYLNHVMGNREKAGYHFTEGMKLPVKYCFPFRLESMEVYQTALDYNGQDARALYYLGNLLYDKQPEKAISYWELAVQHEPGLAMAHRNLGWGYQQSYKRTDDAIEAYYAAVANDPSQPRFYLELDQMLEDRGDPVETRMELLTVNHEHVKKLQDALIREITVLILAGEYDRAVDLLDGRIFYRQEDVNIVHDLHVDAHLLKGKLLLEAGDAGTALEEFLIADTYPENQFIERPVRYERDPRIYYYTGLAYETLGDRKAREVCFARAISHEGIDDEFLYYQAMAHAKSGNRREAEEIFARLIEMGQEQLKETESAVDFFAKFGEEVTEEQQKAASFLLLGLGYMGQNETEKAAASFRKSIEADVNQLWSRVYLESLLK